MAKKSEMVEQVVETHMPTQRVEEVKVTEDSNAEEDVEALLQELELDEI